MVPVSVLNHKIISFKWIYILETLTLNFSCLFISITIRRFLEQPYDITVGRNPMYDVSENKKTGILENMIEQNYKH